MTTTGAPAQRFDALDGMRGIAAVAVLLHHVSITAAPWVFPHAYLAVDFFFVLSGFVLMAAYGQRLHVSLSVADYVTLRAIRLYPLIGLGAIFGAIGYWGVYRHHGLAGAFVCALLLIPTPDATASEGFNAVPINPPAWSLSFEVVANLLFIWAARQSFVVLVSVIAASGLCLLIAIVGLGDVEIGSTWPTLWAGLPRVVFGFFEGCALFVLWRSGALRRIRAPTAALVIGLVLMLFLPRIPGLDVSLDTVAVFGMIPLLVAAGANAAPSALDPAARFAGELSYPVYILQGGFVPHIRGLPLHFGLSDGPAVAVLLGASAVYCAVAWLAYRLVDRPVRAWASHLVRNQPRVPAQTAP